MTAMPEEKSVQTEAVTWKDPGKILKKKIKINRY